MGKMKLILALYSVRDFAERNLLGTLKQIKDMGYDFIELAGLYGHTFPDVKTFLDEAGLIAVSAHVPYPEFDGDITSVVKNYRSLGCEYIIIPYLTEELRPGTPGFDGMMAKLPHIGKVCNDNGMTLLYHNHDFEFVKMEDGRYALDFIFDTVPAELLQTEIDTCWVKVAGVDPVAYVKKYAGRAPIVQLKDFYEEGTVSDGSELIGVGADVKKPTGKFEFRPLGYGMQVIPELLDAAMEAGAEYVVVEQDRSTGRTSLEAVKMSRNYMNTLGV